MAKEINAQGVFQSVLKTEEIGWQPLPKRVVGEKWGFFTKIVLVGEFVVFLFSKET